MILVVGLRRNWNCGKPRASGDDPTFAAASRKGS